MSSPEILIPPPVKTSLPEQEALLPHHIDKYRKRYSHGCTSEIPVPPKKEDLHLSLP